MKRFPNRGLEGKAAPRPSGVKAETRRGGAGDAPGQVGLGRGGGSRAQGRRRGGRSAPAARRPPPPEGRLVRTGREPAARGGGQEPMGSGRRRSPMLGGGR